MMKRKAIVFGGLGFIGLKLIDKLCNSNFKVDIIDINPNKKLLKKIKKTYGDLINIRLLDLSKKESFTKLKYKKYYYIFDCAAFLGVDKIINNSYDSLKNNLLISLNISSFAQQQKKLNKVIFMSSSEVYDGSLMNCIINPPNYENSILSIFDLYHPRTVYMFSKIAGELIYINSKLPYLNLRLHNVFGPRMCKNHSIPTFIKNFFYNKQKVIVYNQNHYRSYIFIDDAIDQIIKLSFSKKILFSTFNIGSDKNVFSNFQIASFIKKLLKSKSKIVFRKNNVNSVVYRKPSLSKFKRYFKINNKNHFIKQLQETVDYFTSK
jgi:UDP-glucose 4-epimerase